MSRILQQWRLVGLLMIGFFLLMRIPLLAVPYDMFVEHPSWATISLHYPGKEYTPPTNITQNGCTLGTWITFPQKIEAIAAKVGCFTNPTALFRSKDFTAMYKHCAYYEQYIVDYLADDGYSLDQKKIAIYAGYHSRQLYKQAYKLYKGGKINLRLLNLVLAANLGSMVYMSRIKNYYKYNLSGWKNLVKELTEFLYGIPPGSVLAKSLRTIIDGQFPAAWEPYLLFRTVQDDDAHRTYFPFKKILSYAVKEKKIRDNMGFGCTFTGLEIPPYFLMMLDHVAYYYPTYYSPYSSIEDGIRVLRHSACTDQEKHLAIVGVSYFGLLDENEAACSWAPIMEWLCDWYRQGYLSVQHLHRIFIVTCGVFPNTPFLFCIIRIREYKGH